MENYTHAELARVLTRRVFYEGTGALVKGQALCYNRDYGTAATAEPQRDVRVEDPTIANMPYFAGVSMQAHDSTTAGKWIDIAMPGSICEGYTDENCTIMDTKLYLAVGGTLGGSDAGLYVGQALQTVDRSGTAGTVMMRLDGIDRTKIVSGLASAAGGASPLLWNNCPWDENVASLYFNDYKGGYQPVTGTSTTEIEDFIQTEVTTGLTAQTANVLGGALQVSSEAFTAADDGLTVMHRITDWVPTTGKPIWFEARIRMTDIDTTPDQFFIGLIDTVTTVHASGVIDDLKDKIAFFTHSGSVAATLSFITAKTTVQEITASAATGLVDATWVKVGFYATLTSVTPYVNGVAGTPHATAASLPTAGTGLGLCLAAHVDQTATIATLDVDWVRIAQLR